MNHTDEHEGKDAHDAIENLVILGSGISGNTAAIYAARASLNPLVIAGPQAGGQLTLTTEVDNFPGFPEGVMGMQLSEDSRKQAERFGTRYKESIAIGFEKKTDHFELILEEEERIKTKSLIIATGASARWLGLPSEQKFKGRGVSTCATCDGFFYKGKEVVIVGGGDSAMEEATFLAKIATKVTVVHRSDSFNASKAMQEKFFNTPNASVLWNTEIAEMLGDSKGLTGAKLKNNKTGEFSEIKCDGIFLALGHVPNTKMFKGILDMDEIGYLITKDTKTNIPGVFASGDVQDRKYRQAITAAGTGCQAALEAERYLESLGHK
jgi:thioredoxin reductase (NADPH)